MEDENFKCCLLCRHGVFAEEMNVDKDFNRPITLFVDCEIHGLVPERFDCPDALVQPIAQIDIFNANEK